MEGSALGPRPCRLLYERPGAREPLRRTVQSLLGRRGAKTSLKILCRNVGLCLERSSVGVGNLVARAHLDRAGKEVLYVFLTLRF